MKCKIEYLKGHGYWCITHDGYESECKIAHLQTDLYDANNKITLLQAEKECLRLSNSAFRGDVKLVEEREEQLKTELAEAKKRPKPPEFLETEIFSLEQVVPLYCRAEANAIIDIAIEAIVLRDREIMQLKEAKENSKITTYDNQEKIL